MIDDGSPTGPTPDEALWRALAIIIVVAIVLFFCSRNSIEISL